MLFRSPNVCSKSGNDSYLAKCSYHLNLAFKKSKKALAKKKALSSAEMAARTEISRLSMRKSRMKRKHEIIGIENGNVLRICALIDRIKSHQEYVIVPNVVSSLLKASEIKLIGKREPINFHQSKRPWKRFM